MRSNRILILISLLSGSLVAMDAPTPGKRKYEPNEESELRLPKRSAVESLEKPQTEEELKELQSILDEATSSSSDEAPKVVAAAPWKPEGQFPLSDLPGEIIVMVLQALAGTSSAQESAKAFQNLAQTNKAFNAFLNDPGYVFPLVKFIATTKKITLLEALNYINSKSVNQVKDILDDVKYWEFYAARKKIAFLDREILRLFASLIMFQAYSTYTAERLAEDEITSKGFDDLMLALVPHVDPNSRNQNGSTLLLEAITAQQLPVVNALLMAGADANGTSNEKGDEGLTPLAVIRKHLTGWPDFEPQPFIDLLKKYGGH